MAARFRSLPDRLEQDLADRQSYQRGHPPPDRMLGLVFPDSDRGMAMRIAWMIAAASLWGALHAQDLATRAWDMEKRGDPAGAERMLRQTALGSPESPTAQVALAEFLERHRNADARGAYERAASVIERTNGSATQRANVEHKLATFDLLQGDRASAVRRLSAYAAAGGTGLAFASTPTKATAPTEYIEIPGPLRSFSRMAALSPELALDEVLPALGRNVVTNGYRAYSSNEALEQTEYLSLVLRYLSQARELERLAGADRVIRIAQCDSSETGVLLRVIGYRLRGSCGGDVVLETINASRAFLTTDSGFPLGELEIALRTNRPFTLDYQPTRVPLLYSRDYWQPPSTRGDARSQFIDYFVSDPSLARLYVGISKIDPETAELLRAAMPAARFKLFAHVLDFFGTMFRVRNGRALVPGGARAEKTWAELNGIHPERGVDFFQRLLAQDDGWLASYFDSLSRIQGPVQDYLTAPEHLERFYEAVRGKVTTPGPARPVFRSNTDMLLLTTRLRVDADGRPHLPGGLETWRKLFIDPPRGVKADSRLRRDAAQWREPDQVMEALFGMSRRMAENEHLKIFMALTDVDRRRAQPLSGEVMEALARNYEALSAQYAMLAESNLSGPSILKFLATANRIGDIGNQTRRADTVGMLQSLLGLWQIFVRQGTMRPGQVDSSFMAVLTAFDTVGNDRELFDAGRRGVQALLEATASPNTATSQERMLDLLAGAVKPLDSDAYQRLVQNLIRVFEAQRLVSLDALFQLADNLEGVGKGQPLNTALVGRLANRMSDIQLPQGDLSRAERNSGSYGYWTEKHIDDQRKINLRRDLEKAGTNPKDLADLRGALAPFLRDTLVGFNYMHYAPPGAQILFTNPLFVRSHDFIGVMGSEQTWKASSLYGMGWPRNAGGRLVGSLAGLPYALAQAEQNFLVPTREQALIWGDLVPQMMLTAVVPRWWNVSQAQIHWVGLHVAYGETALAEAALSPSVRDAVVGGLEPSVAPRRLKTIEDALQVGDVVTARDNVMPSELFWLARKLTPTDRDSSIASEIRRLATEDPGLSDAAISHIFGTPKPTLSNSYDLELLNLRTFPTLMGYSSRILAESWESNLIYFAALADQIHARPEDMNVLVPEWTQRTLEQIFASHLEDWPALLRSLRTVGQQVITEHARETVAGLGGSAQ
jgi:hypothetical protein